MLDFQKLSADYQQALLRQVVPFWLKNSRDELCGGYFDTLTTTGDIVETDKYITSQAQQTWAFAWLYNRLDGQSAWLDHARYGAAFLSQFAHNEHLDCYGILDRRGRPVAAAADVVPDSFTVRAYVQMYQATGDDEWSMLAQQTFRTLLHRRATIRLDQLKTLGGFRQLRHLSEPVAVLSAVLDMQPLLSEEIWKEAIDALLLELLREFLDRRTDTLREYVLPEGAFVNTPEGRRLNTGLTFRAVSVLLDLCDQLPNRKLAMQTVTWALRACEQAWDEPNGGFFQYIDFKEQPLPFPDWRQKWAWVHLEALSALTKGYFHTRHPECPKWFKRIHDYVFHVFPDPRHIGWHLVLDHKNHPFIPVKVTHETGCYSAIRCLTETAQTLSKCGQLQPLGRTVRVA